MVAKEILDRIAVLEQEIKGLEKEIITREEEIAQLNKHNQLALIQAKNPEALKTAAGTITAPEELLTFSEVFEMASENEDFPEGFSREEAEEVLEEGYLSVYALPDIQPGDFLWTTLQEAQAGAGDAAIEYYLPDNDIAWLSIRQGIFAAEYEIVMEED